MRFLSRSLTGLVLGLLALALLLVAATTVQRAMRDGESGPRGAAPGQERVFAVNVVRPEPETIVPVVRAYGEVLAPRALDVRAGIGGRLVELAPGFRDGGEVGEGDLLFAIDPAEAEAARDAAAIDLEEAAAEGEEARTALDFARADREAAENQRDLRARTLERQRNLQGRGVGAVPELEAAEIALSQAEQTVINRAQAEAQAEMRIERAGIALARARLAAAEAERRLRDTRAVAPFAGIMAEVTARPGTLVGANELLGTLIDPTALEVSFRLSGTELSRLIAPGGGLAPQPLTVRLDLDGAAIALPGRLDRVGAVVGAGQSGRLVYARLEADATGLLRPGDFVEVEVEEPPLAEVARLPAASVGPDGRILVAGEDDRLVAASVTILRRQGDDVIAADLPWGARVVAALAPQLAPGIRVRVLEAPREEMVALDAARRSALIAAVEADRRLPPERKAELVEALGADEVPRSLVDRVDTRAGG